MHIRICFNAHLIIKNVFFFYYFCKRISRLEKCCFFFNCLIVFLCIFVCLSVSLYLSSMYHLSMYHLCIIYLFIVWLTSLHIYLFALLFTYFAIIVLGVLWGSCIYDMMSLPLSLNIFFFSFRDSNYRYNKMSDVAPQLINVAFHFFHPTLFLVVFEFE